MYRIFTSHNTGRGKIINIAGDYIKITNCVCEGAARTENAEEEVHTALAHHRTQAQSKRDDRDDSPDHKRSEEGRRRRATRTGHAEDAEEEDHEALAHHRTRAPASQQDRDDSPDNKRSSSTPAAAVSIQFNLTVGGPSCEGRIVVSYRVVAVSTGAFFLRHTRGPQSLRLWVLRRIPPSRFKVTAHTHGPCALDKTCQSQVRVDRDASRNYTHSRSSPADGTSICSYTTAALDINIGSGTPTSSSPEVPVPVSQS
ncbi:hypothetical protein FIBSPDRAFT_949541 [Athelia psychrophila]|uniref:Uncharacterized protein n=1 Tax=Athelia psychrophila TaxID=1759441 RepID=A0A166PRC6_9AGAM|nr:hypothetical protein FIBSPDRAFT_949541 [Fibularhizoctonia sp. CBS 109695]